MIPIAKPILGECERKKIMEVLDSGVLALGSYVEKFEKRFSEYIGARYGVSTTSGTSALCIALKAIGIGEEDRVLTTPFSFIATANSILYCNGRPEFCDIDEETFNITPENIEEKLCQDDRIKALLIVHLYGLPCDMKRILRICREYKIRLIEDCAQAHGAEYRGRRVGSFGDLSCFSFYPTKNMTTGEGGMILTNNEELAENCRMYINHGMRERYRHEMLGFNYRMTNLQAALGLCQLEKLDGFNERRIQNAKFLSENLELIEFLETPHLPRNVKHVFHQYTIKLNVERDGFLEHLSRSGVGYGVYYPRTIPQQPLYRKLGYDEKFKIADDLAKRVVSLPVHPALSEEDLEKIVSVVSNYRK
ncbi:MAG: aminotransferase DegT [Candidatus Altiarchaeales archaeon]|nr:MAG: aminotransferase DegT [Candidatus Altiarchaeales archaeon]RLI94440.1 MAG: aminotransferase DegT [Candidatus Altiarchaeales archaeon]HDO81983.1 DegT/DnrJ/EryC1/StrS family aminotransferase [Candidatus Altiarchaeales archaeon]HEX54632.1 DegT/DnrJ/EryC1/StrS family aminotransferase [Candidatus Altiarchaeales archaeon]